MESQNWNTASSGSTVETMEMTSGLVLKAFGRTFRAAVRKVKSMTPMMRKVSR